MYGLLRFIVKYGAVILFILLEGLALYWVVKHNKGQRTIFMYSSQQATGYILDQYDKAARYMKMGEVADSLAAENARMKQLLVRSASKPHTNSLYFKDSALTIIPARVISNSVSLRNNVFIIDKGKRDGVQEGMGVMGKTGPIGRIIASSKSYSRALSILHSQSMTSVKLKHSGYFGSMIWSGTNPQKMKLTAVPKHAPVEEGDSIVTSGYSFIYPEGAYVGKIIKHTTPPGSNFYDIDIKLAYEMSNLKYAYVLKSDIKKELKTLNPE